MFTIESESIARDAMNRICPQITNQYASLVRFLSKNPELAANSRTNIVGSYEYIEKQALSFYQARNLRSPKPPGTIPDEMVSIILVSYFNIDPQCVNRIKQEHLLSMSAENIVGELLERYLSSVMEAYGWIWCSGSMVKAVDFIKPMDEFGNRWDLLQVKNRDNSENSSSSAIRNGSPIKKWHRTFSRTGLSNWEAFPDENAKRYLSEQNFTTFVINYLNQLKTL